MHTHADPIINYKQKPSYANHSPSLPHSSISHHVLARQLSSDANKMGNQTKMGNKTTAFTTQVALLHSQWEGTGMHSATRTSARRGSKHGGVPTRTIRMVIDPATVGSGYAFLDSLKGVVIGPTVNEVMSAICGGTVGVMGTIMTLEVRRQQVKERKQCPYCRGTGKMPCATCYSVGTIPCTHAATAHTSCDSCAEAGYLRCNHVRVFTFPSFLC